MNKIIDETGAVNWNLIATSFPGRTGKQCRERWHNHLFEGIKKGDWTEEEDMVILKSHERLGNQWSKISKLLEGRSDTSVKNRFNVLKRQYLPKAQVQDIASMCMNPINILPMLPNPQVVVDPSYYYLQNPSYPLFNFAVPNVYYQYVPNMNMYSGMNFVKNT